GLLGEGATIVESTSGTLGLGLALSGIVFGHPVTVVTDPGLDRVVRRLLNAYGATVDTVAEPHPDGGWQQARRDRVRAILDRAGPDAYCPDQYRNPDNVAAYAGLGHELVSQFERVDVLVCGVGTGGHSAGITAVLRERWPRLRLVGVDAVGSTIFGQPARPRLMRGLGSSIYPDNVAYAAFDEVHWVAPAEAVWTCRRLAARSYATGGWSVGAVGLVAAWVARVSPEGSRVVAVFPDGPHRYADSVFDDEFCRRHELAAGPPALEPDEIGRCDEREVLRWTRCTTVTDPCGRRRRTGDPTAR
ncbi:PLP-dependent cysteine synthase family protein, partial [Candidatus Protofrankia californiensis]|uniref:PLP-dependent cysteine synthase family protein n=1 Tax=Candidatus Protofrankia californiensis TaxID=1839754 RepID=UPI001040EC63